MSPTIRKRNDRGGRSRSPSARRRFERQLSPPRKRRDRCALLTWYQHRASCAPVRTACARCRERSMHLLQTTAACQLYVHWAYASISEAVMPAECGWNLVGAVGLQIKT